MYRGSKLNVAPEIESSSVLPVRPVWTIMPYLVHMLLTNPVLTESTTESCSFVLEPWR